MERKENLCQPPEYPAEMFSEYIESAKARALRASEIEAILGDDYDLNRLRELVEADKQGSLTIYPDPKYPAMHSDPVGPEGETGVLDSEWYKRAGELLEADREGRCYITTVKIGERVFLPNEKGEIIGCRVQGISLPAHGKDLIIHLGGYPAEYLWTDREGKDWWKTKEAAEAALKGDQHG